MCERREYVDAGGLVSYSATRLKVQARRILSGQNS